MAGMVITLPIRTSEVEAWRRFCQELSGSRRQPYAASRRRMGITRERLALVETAFGATTVTALEALDVTQALHQIITSQFPFDVWYREQWQILHSIHLAEYESGSPPPPNLDHPELLFEWAFNEDQPRKN